MIEVKILSYKNPQRYAVKRTLIAAQDELQEQHQGIEIALTEVKEVSDMLEYTDVLILPSLVVNEKLVCVGRFPKKDEIIRWLQDAIEEHA
jgi:hypothetical protein